ncbi:MAG: hypothetical protein J5517_04830 [Eubacterium sp.]|nr:hypothetical protein [Eubacterium sp.]
MPPIGKDFKVDKNHPFIEYEAITQQVVNPQTNQPEDVIIGYSPKLTGLTPEIISNGDLATLMSFYQQNQDKMTENEKVYMQARIEASTEIDRLRNKAYADIAEGRQPETQTPSNQNGYLGYADIKSPGIQTSGNGCWSVAYSLLLKSRGVDLSQDIIRGWRPDQTKQNLTDQQKLNAQGEIAAANQRMNSDEINNIPENADLLTQVLPNTSMKTIEAVPIFMSDIQVDGKNPTAEEAKAIKEKYIEQSVTLFKKSVTRALTEDHSPVAVTKNGHYMTITGISEDGSRIRCEDTLQATAEERTRYIKIEDFVKDAMEEKEVIDKSTDPPTKKTIFPTGFGMTWLSDIKVPEYDKRNIQHISGRQDEKDYIDADEDGNLEIKILTENKDYSAYGKPTAGQIEGKGLNIPVVMDLNVLPGKTVTSKSQKNSSYRMGSYDSYYPNKVYYLKDPTLSRNRQNGQYQINPDLAPSIRRFKRKAVQARKNGYPYEQAVQFLQEDYVRVRDYILNDQNISSRFNDPNLRNDLDAAFMNDPIGYSISLSDDLVNNLGLQQKMQGLPNNFVATLRNLDKKVDDAIAHNYKGQFLDTFLREDVTKLWDIITADPYLSREYSGIKDTFNQNFTANPAQFTKAFINDTIEVFELGGLRRSQTLGSIKDTKLMMDMRWRALNPDGGPGTLSPDQRKDMLAEIVALSEIQARKMMKGDKNPQTTTRELSDLTEKVKTDKAFNQMIANGNDVKLAKLRDTKKLKSSLISSIKLVKSERDYDISSHRKLTQKRCKFLAARFEEAGAGKNDREFDSTLESIRYISATQNASSQEVMQCVNNVKEYISDKMNARGADRTKWGLCMMFLKETMPRKEFEDYCRQINVSRGVENKPSSAKYVSPEMFGYKKEPVRCALAETKHRLLEGKGTERDYAAIIAMRTKFDYVGFLDGEKTFEKEADRRKYIKETEKVLASPEFKRFMKEVPDDQKKALLVGECDGLVNYRTILPPVAQTQTVQKNQPQNRQKPTQPATSPQL